MRRRFWITTVLLLAVLSASAFSIGSKSYFFDDTSWLKAVRNTDLPALSVSNSPPGQATQVEYTFTIQSTNILRTFIPGPGEWVIGNVQISIESSPSRPLNIRFKTSGDLSSGSYTLPTYYHIFDGVQDNGPGGGNDHYYPNMPVSTSSAWHRASEDYNPPNLGMNGYPRTRGNGNDEFQLWLAVVAGEFMMKGNYSGWIEIEVTLNP